MLHCAFGVLMQNMCLAHMCCSEPHTGRVWQGISYWLSAVVLTACPGFTATTNRFHELNTHVFIQRFTYCVFLSLPLPLTPFGHLVNTDCKSHVWMINVALICPAGSSSDSVIISFMCTCAHKTMAARNIHFLSWSILCTWHCTHVQRDVHRIIILLAV